LTDGLDERTTDELGVFRRSLGLDLIVNVGYKCEVSSPHQTSRKAGAVPEDGCLLDQKGTGTLEQSVESRVLRADMKPATVKPLDPSSICGLRFDEGCELPEPEDLTREAITGPLADPRIVIV
jgi:hypothetical protein